MEWWQVILTVGVPFLFERLWTIKGFKKVPTKLQPTIEQAARLAVEQAIRQGLGHQSAATPAAQPPLTPAPLPRPGKK